MFVTMYSICYTRTSSVFGQLLLRMASLIYIPNGKSCNASDQIYDILMLEKWNPKWNLIWKALGQHITSFSWPFFICLQAQCSVHRSASVHFSTTYLIKCPAFDGLFAQRIFRVSCWRKHSGQCSRNPKYFLCYFGQIMFFYVMGFVMRSVMEVW